VAEEERIQTHGGGSKHGGELLRAWGWMFK
jgi:hypothetical protein